MDTAIGIDIGGTNMRAAQVSAGGVISKRLARATPTTPSLVIAALEEMIAALDGPEIKATGIGVPGRVDVERGVIFSGGYVDLSGEALSERLKREVFADNDGNMAMVAEAKTGAAKGLREAVMLTIGTGIGGAILHEGQIYHGRATAGQLGHLTVVTGGLPCTCGRLGCVETTSSGTALGRLIAEAGLPATTTADELLQRDDAAAKAILRAWAMPLRSAIDSLAAALDPELVILGGGLGAEACAALAPFPAAAPWFQCSVVPAQHGGDAGVIGAALAALERIP
jgi:glucokinase